MNMMEKRIMQVSEMISKNICEVTLGFRSMDGAPHSDAICTMEKILDPEIEYLEKCMYRVINKHNLSDAILNSLRFTQINVSYTIGVIAGLHLAGRSDLIPKLAKAYAATTIEQPRIEYDEDGSYAKQ